MSWFNRARPEQTEDAQEAWITQARRAVFASVPLEITFRLSMAFHENEYLIHVAFVTNDKVFVAKPSEDPTAFAKKKVVPWILSSGLHV